MGLHFNRCPKNVELDNAAATKDTCAEMNAFQAGASEPPKSPVVNKIFQEFEEDANTSKLESIKFECAGTPLIKLSPGKLGKRVEITTPSQVSDSVNRNVLNRTEGESETGTEESLVPKAFSHFDEDTSGDPDLKLLGGCRIQISPAKSVPDIERTNIEETNIPAKAEFPPIQQCNSPDECGAVDVPPETQ